MELININNPIDVAIVIAILVYSAILHEIAHGYIADRLGDPTARLMGRLTLDPRPHIDPLLSILLPLLLLKLKSPVIFGGAKPVPIDPFNLKDGRKDIALVSLAGPLTNILLAVLATIIIQLFFPAISLGILSHESLIGFILATTVQINVLLALFNLLPIPPLDGSKIFALILPEKISETYLSFSSFGTLILLFLLLFPIGGFSLMSVVANLYHVSLGLLGF